MNELAKYMDMALVGVFVLTISIIVYKFLDIWAPRAVFRPSLEELANGDSDSLDEAVEQKEAGLALLAQIAATAPFLGLMGTVMHIIVALQSLQGAGINVALLYGPLATAMYATLWGLAAAIPATLAYNLFAHQVGREAGKLHRRIVNSKEV